MTENTPPSFDASDDGIYDDIPLGNYEPLIVPNALGQSFLQPKFIYPLGAISLLSPDNLDINSDSEFLASSFEDSPFFNSPLQSPSLNTIQTKSVASKANLQEQSKFLRSASGLISDRPIQRSSELSDLSQIDNITQSDRTIQRESDFTIQPILDSQTTEIQRQVISNDVESINSPQIQRSNDNASPIPSASTSDQPIAETTAIAEIPDNQSHDINSDINQAVQRQVDTADLTNLESDRNIQARVNADYSAPIDRNQPDIARLDNITQSDRTIQRESDTIQPILDSQSTEIQRQVISNDIELNNSPRIQKSNDNASPIPSTSTSNQPIAEIPDNQSNDINQVVQRQVDTTDLPIVNNTPLESDRNIQTSVNADYSAPIRYIAQDINLSQTNAIQRQTNDLAPIDRNQPDIARLDGITQSDRTIQRESDFTIQPILDSQTTEIQRQVISNDVESINSPQIQRSNDNASPIQSTSTSDHPIAEILDSQSNDINQVVQRQVNAADLPSLPLESDRNIQARVNADYSAPIDRNQTDIARLDGITQSDRTIQRKSDTIQPILDSQSTEIQRQVISNDIELNNSPRIQKSNDNASPIPSTSTSDQPIAEIPDNQSNDTNQVVQRQVDASDLPNLPIVLPTVNNTPLESDRNIQASSNADYSAPIRAIAQDINLSQTDAIQRQTNDPNPIDRNQPDIAQLDDITQSDRTIRGESDFTIQPSQTTEIQRQVISNDVESINSPQIQRSNDNASPIQSASTSDHPIAEILDNQSNDTNQVVQRQVDAADLPNLESDRNIQARVNADYSAPIDRNQTDIARLDNITQSDRTIQRESDFTIQPILDSQTTEIQRQVISNDVESINSPQIQRYNDNASPIQSASTSDHPISEILDNQSNDTNQVVQRQVDASDLPNLPIVLPTVNNTPLESDRNIQARVNADYSAPIRAIAQDINLSQTDAIQRQTNDPNPIDRNQPDIAQLDNITQSDRTIQREPDFTIQPVLDSQTTEIQRSSDDIPPIQNALTSDQPIAEILDNQSNDTNQVFQRQVDTAIQKKTNDLAPIDRSQPDIEQTDGITQSDRTIQRESDFTIQPSQTTEIQRQVISNIESINSPQIQRSNDNASPIPSTSTSDQPISEILDNQSNDINQVVQRQVDTADLPNLPIVLPTVNNTPLESDRNIQARVNADYSAPIDRNQTDIARLDNITQSDRTIQREPDFTIQPVLDSQTTEIQRSSDDIPPIQNALTSDQPIAEILDNQSNDTNQVVQRQVDTAIQKKTNDLAPIDRNQPDIARLDNITQSDRTIQRESDFTIQPVLDSQTTEIQRSSDDIPPIQNALTSDQPIAEILDNQSNDTNQVVQRQVDAADLPNLPIVLPTVNNTPLESDRNIQARVNADYSAPIRAIAQDINLSQTDAIQRQTNDPNPIDRNQPDIAQLDDITQSDRTIQRELSPSIQPILDSQTTEIQSSSSNSLSDHPIDNPIQDTKAPKPTLIIDNNIDLINQNQSLQRQSEITNSSILSSILNTDIQRNDGANYESSNSSPLNISADQNTNILQRKDHISQINPSLPNESSSFIEEISTLNSQSIQQNNKESTREISQGNFESHVTKSPIADTEQSNNQIIQRKLSMSDPEIDINITPVNFSERIQRDKDHNVTLNETLVNLDQNEQETTIQSFSDLQTAKSITGSITESNISESDRLQQSPDRAQNLGTPKSDIADIQKKSDLSPVGNNLETQLDNIRDSNTKLSADNQNNNFNRDLVGNSTQDLQQSIQRNSSSEVNAIDSNSLEDSIENQTMIQMMKDPSNTEALKLPKAIENLGHTEYLGSFASLNLSQVPSTPQQRTLQPFRDRNTRSNNSKNLNNLSDNIRNQPKDIQRKENDTPDQSNRTDAMTNGWSNIAELLANLPPPQTPTNSSTSSLNRKTVSDRSPLAIAAPKTSTDSARSSSTNQTVIQRSPEQKNSYNNSPNSDQDLYLTPTGLQRGNPNKDTNPTATIQRALDTDPLPEATVSVKPIEEQDEEDEDNLEHNLETLAQEIYILLKQRLGIEKERQGNKYQGRLPW